MKKCLLIATNFPPSRGSGTKRTAAISKYLTGLGWSVFILTFDDGYYASSPEDKKYIPEGVKVIKTKMLFPKLYKNLSTKLRIYYEYTNKVLQIIKFLIAGILHYLLVPDRFLTWLPYGYKAGLDLIKKEKIDVIYSTAPYFSAHLLALRLKNKTQLPWVAEFRDSWSSNPDVIKKFFIKKRIEKKMEKRVIKNCDAIVAVSPLINQEFQSIYPDIPVEKFCTVTNGFDSENFPPLPVQQNSVFTICYTGIIAEYREIGLVNFITAISNLMHPNSAKSSASLRTLSECAHPNKKIDPEKIKINFWGNFLPKAAQLIKNLNLEQIFSYGTSISYEKSLFEQQKSHLLLFFDNDPEIYGKSIPAKLYEYFGSQRPILALTYKNTLAREIIEKTHTGKIILNNNIKDIETAILDCYQEFYQQGKINYQPNKEEVQKYNYGFLTKKINNLLISISNRPPQKITPNLTLSQLKSYYENKALEIQNEIKSTYESPYFYRKYFYLSRFDKIMGLLDIRPEDKILEIGCGPGYYTKLIASKTPNLITTDIAQNYLDQAKANNPYEIIDYVCCPVEKLPFPDNSFNKILMTEVIEHLLNPEKALQKIYRVLKPGGKLIISTPNKYSPINFFYHLKIKIMGPHFEHIKEYSIQEIKKMLKKYFLIEKIGFINYLMFYRLKKFPFTKNTQKAIKFLEKIEDLLNKIPIIKNFGLTLIVRVVKSK